VVAPDAGRVKVAERYSQHLGVDLALVHKTRPRGSHNEVEALHVVGDVEGRHCVLIDDMIDTAGTICAAAELLSEAGAADVWVMATHAVLSDPAVDRLKAAPISRVVVTDTLPVAETAASTSSRCSRWPRSSPTPSTPSSRTPRSPSSSGATTWSEGTSGSRVRGGSALLGKSEPDERPA
jgi:ribose-phosphate pyrophosphokinase